MGRGRHPRAQSDRPGSFDLLDDHPLPTTSARVFRNRRHQLRQSDDVSAVCDSPHSSGDLGPRELRGVDRAQYAVGLALALALAARDALCTRDRVDVFRAVADLRRGHHHWQHLPLLHRGAPHHVHPAHRDDERRSNPTGLGTITSELETVARTH